MVAVIKAEQIEAVARKQPKPFAAARSPIASMSRQQAETPGSEKRCAVLKKLAHHLGAVQLCGLSGSMFTPPALQAAGPAWSSRRGLDLLGPGYRRTQRLRDLDPERMPSSWKPCSRSRRHRQNQTRSRPGHGASRFCAFKASRLDIGWW